MPSIRRIGILTGGGDCPGLNAVLRAVTKTALYRHGVRVFGVEDGFQGLIDNRVRPLHVDDVDHIVAEGGTVLGTSNRSSPFNYRPAGSEDEPTDVSDRVVRRVEALRIDAILAAGGDGTMAIAHRLSMCLNGIS